ncbi:hypothetical protein [Pseudomonas sp. SST3]|uniref:hypothetical protein n=1 Tax=Pseudomonas sp. SST3 TaxID=2267882 RepID=UPI001443CC24|nr:hypothetical protein [Pseudomonas sp. SST3]NKQ13288.1 hypothetical protein [Pseudomonas sp. SST3]
MSILKPDCHVDVFEREEQALHLQRGCLQRNLHPHIYEWPRQGAREGSAGLPFLNWSAGTADSVAAEVMRQFGTLQAHRPNALAIKVLREVTAIERIGTAAYRVRHQSDRGDDLLAASYDAVFIAIGFGRERQLGNAPWNSYWSDRGVPGAPRYADHDTTILISGAGDGGLIDLCAAALQDFDHTALIELVTTWPGIEEISEALLQIDLEAEQFGRGFDFLAAYGRFVGPRLRDDGLIGEIAGRLRKSCKYYLQILSGMSCWCNQLQRSTGYWCICFSRLRMMPAYQLGTYLVRFQRMLRVRVSILFLEQNSGSMSCLYAMVRPS